MSQFRNSEIDELMADFCHATSNPRRSLILRLLAERERTVSELVEATGFGPANLSQHLKLLRDKRIVAVQRQGGRATYRLLQPKILEAMRLMREAFLETLGTDVPTGDADAPGFPGAGDHP
jgi:ArsR family transcriptional regulator